MTILLIVVLGIMTVIELIVFVKHPGLLKFLAVLFTILLIVELVFEGPGGLIAGAKMVFYLLCLLVGIGIIRWLMG